MAYIPRLTTTTPTALDKDNHWYYKDNPFYQSNYGLPNCTCYAWGRYCEIRGVIPTSPRLPTSDAGKWWGASKAFNRGQTPALGAIACWYDPKGTYTGHVGIVEEIDGDDWTCSYSGWGGPFFATRKILKSDSYRFARGNGFKYTFQGFIYNDAQDLEPEKPDEPAQSLQGEWHSARTGGFILETKNGVRYPTDKGLENCVCIFNQLSSYGWKLSAIAGVLGNMAWESELNPWRWEGNVILSSNDSRLNNTRGNGYGLVQWTPSSGYCKDEVCMKRVDFSPNFKDITGKATDGACQIWALENRTVPTGQWFTNRNYREVSISFANFKVNENSPEWSALAFMANYLRPGNNPATGKYWFFEERQKTARYFYDYFLSWDPQTPKEPTPIEDPETDPVVIPVVSPTAPSAKIEAQWYGQNTGGFARESEQAYNNACKIFNILFFDYKWTVRAICGVLGNVELESNYNPFHWDSDAASPSFWITWNPNTGHYYEATNTDIDTVDWVRYGFLSWYPMGFYAHDPLPPNPVWRDVYGNETNIEWRNMTAAYVNFLNPDWYEWIDAAGGVNYTITAWKYRGTLDDCDYQVKFLGEASTGRIWMGNANIWIPSGPYSHLEFNAYRRSAAKVDFTTRAFAMNYLHKGIDDSSMDQRVEAANYWYKIFKSYEDTGLLSSNTAIVWM